MTDQTLEQRARGLLASEFPLADGFSAVLVRDMSIPQLGVVDTAIALRAIVAALQAQQPGAQAVAWHTDDHLTDKSATTYDPVIADRWRAKGWPVTPHYTDPQPPSIPEPSEDDVEAALFAMDARFTKRTKRPGYASLSEADKSIVKEGIRAALTTYTARLRERLGQAPGGDGDAS